MNYDIPAGGAVRVFGTCRLTPGGTIWVSADTAGGVSCGPASVYCAEGEGEVRATIPDDVDPTKDYPFSASAFNRTGPGHLSFGGVAYKITSEEERTYSTQRTEEKDTRLRHEIGETKEILQGTISKTLELADGTKKSTTWTYSTKCTRISENSYNLEVNESEGSQVDFSVKKSDEVVFGTAVHNSRGLYAKATYKWLENADGTTTDPKEVAGSYTEYWKDDGTRRYIGKKLAGEPWQIFDENAYLAEPSKVVQLCFIYEDPPAFEDQFLDVIKEIFTAAKMRLLESAQKDLETRKKIIKNINNYFSEFNQFFPVVDDESGEPVENRFEFAEKNATIGAKSGNAMVEILTEINTWNKNNWRIECDKTWLYHNYVENVGKFWFKVVATNNTANTERTATVKVYNTTTDELADTLTITQQSSGTIEPPPPPPPPPKIIYEPQVAYIDHKAQRVYVRIINPVPIEEAHLDVSSLKTSVEGDYLVIDVPENTTTNTIRTGGSIVVNGITDYSQYFTITQRPPEVEVPILDRHGKQVLLAGTRIFKILK